MPLRFRDIMVESMIDLGAEIVGINNYHTLVFAENVRRYEELAEGTRSILLHCLFVQK